MSTNDFFDANAIAAELRTVFCDEVTDAEGQCTGCGRIAPLAEGRVYAFAPGIVIRCAGCEQPLLRLVRTEDRFWLDARGIAYLQVRMR